MSRRIDQLAGWLGDKGSDCDTRLSNRTLELLDVPVSDGPELNSSEARGGGNMDPLGKRASAVCEEPLDARRQNSAQAASSSASRVVCENALDQAVRAMVDRRISLSSSAYGEF